MRCKPREEAAAHLRVRLERVGEGRTAELERGPALAMHVARRVQARARVVARWSQLVRLERLCRSAHREDEGLVEYLPYDRQRLVDHRAQMESLARSDPRLRGLGDARPSSLTRGAVVVLEEAVTV